MMTESERKKWDDIIGKKIDKQSEIIKNNNNPFTRLKLYKKLIDAELEKK